MKRIICAICFVAIAGIVSNAFADDTGINGFNGLFFRPNVDGKGILNVDSADVLFPGAMHVGSHFQYARRTISFSDPTLGGLVTDLAENQVLMNLIMGVGLLKYLDAGIDIPIVFMQNGTKCINATCTTVSNYTGSALGDIRFVLKLRILEDKENSVGLALASDIGIPTGKRRLFTGGKGPSYEQRLIVSKKFKHVDVAANVGYRVVDRVEALGIVYDDMFTFGAGVKGHLPHNLFAYGTIAGNTLLSERGASKTPVEFMGGIGRRWKKRNIECSIGGGSRLVDGVTAADFRAMGSCGISFGLTKKAREHFNSYRLSEWLIPMKTNQYRLKLAQKELLDDVIRWMTADRKRRVMVVGNADDRRSYDYNMKLSTKRAIATRDYLFAHGVLPEQVSIGTYGEAKPLVAGKREEERTMNRSVVIKEVHD